MNIAAQLLLAIAGIVLGLVVSISVMIFGWGLEPKNWLVIIALQSFCAQLFIEAAKLLNKD